MHLSTSQFSRTWSFTAAAAAVIAITLSTVVHADDTLRAGRYVDRSVLVHNAAQLNPLAQVANLHFSSRITVGDALRTALIGTGYHLVDPAAHPYTESRAILGTRLAIPHQNFAEKRIDSIISAVIGAGHGFTLEVDHIARQVRVIPALAVETPSARPPYPRYPQASHEQGLGR